MFILNNLHKYLVQTKNRTNTLNTNLIGFNYITKRYNRPKIPQCYFDYQSIKIRKEQNIFEVKYHIFGKKYSSVVLDINYMTNPYIYSEKPPRYYALDSIAYHNYQLDINDPICKLCRSFDIPIDYNIIFEIAYDMISGKIYYDYEFSKHTVHFEYIKNKFESLQIYDNEYDLPIKEIIRNGEPKIGLITKYATSIQQYFKSINGQF